MIGSSIIDFIERLRTKPEHVRRRIALSTALGTTGIVAMIWLLTLVSSGVLLLNHPSGTGGGSDGTVAQTSGNQTSSPLLGGVGASNGTGGASAQPALNVVDSPTPVSSSTSQGSVYDSNYNAPSTVGSGGNQSSISF